MYETRLLQIKGRRNVRVVVCKVDVSSLNSGDVFILDAGLILYQWNGKDASRSEKSKALDVTLAIKDEERGGRAKIIAVNEGEANEATAAFFQALGFKGDPATAKIKDASEGGSDDAPEAAGGPIKMYEAQDPKGQQWTLIEQRPLTKAMLKSEARSAPSPEPPAPKRCSCCAARQLPFDMATVAAAAEALRCL